MRVAGVKTPSIDKLGTVAEWRALAYAKASSVSSAIDSRCSEKANS